MCENKIESCSKSIKLNDIKKITEDIKYLKNKKNKLREDYIEKYREFKDGDKVLVTVQKSIDISTKETYFIKSCYIDYHYELKYTFFKCKKDGTISKHSEFVDPFKIELYDSNYQHKSI